VNKMVLIFTDVDGTLVHYGEEATCDASLLRLPVSSSGLRGSVSETTLHLLQRLRRSGHRVALVTGMRTTTFFSRLPFLPLCDAHAIENGGRIFFHEPERNTAACLCEDEAWRASHGAFIDSAERSEDSLLWRTMRRLAGAGCRCDADGYMTQFRVRPPSECSDGEAFVREALKELPSGLAFSFNLGCADVYPATSGKSNAASYIAERFSVSLSSSVFLCDDDNDIDLALRVRRAFAVGITSASLGRAVVEHPQQFYVASGRAHAATQDALQAVTAFLADERPPAD